MKRAIYLFLLSFALMAGVGRVAVADNLVQAVTLVATDSLDGTPFEQTVLIAAPLPNGGHVGFIINRPTSTPQGSTTFSKQRQTMRVISSDSSSGLRMSSSSRSVPAHGT